MPEEKYHHLWQIEAILDVDDRANGGGAQIWQHRQSECITKENWRRVFGLLHFVFIKLKKKTSAIIPSKNLFVDYESCIIIVFISMLPERHLT